jgi:hypothetical protein
MAAGTDGDRRRSRRGTEPGSLLTPRPRIDEVLQSPEVRDLMETAKLHYAVAAGIDPVARPVEHQAAAFPASVAMWQMVDAVRSEPRNRILPERAVYNYILNLVYAQLTAPLATEEDRRYIYQPVSLPRGRPPTQRPRLRQALIDEIRARPEMADYRIKDRALSLGLWSRDQANDPANVRRRIARLRRDAAK